MNKSNEHIIFFDGVCVLCQRSVKYLLRIDKHNKFYYSSLQSEFATQYQALQERIDGKLNTIVYSRKGKLYTKSDAVLRVLMDMGGLRKAYAMFLIIPRPVRNYIYDLIASYRYKVFGKSEQCDLIDMQKHKSRLIA